MGRRKRTQPVKFRAHHQHDNLQRLPLPLELPQEILGKIFIACLPESKDQQMPLICKDDPPMLLCQVCRSWREIAISLPILWSTFDPGGPYKNPLSSKKVALLDRAQKISQAWDLSAFVLQLAVFDPTYAYELTPQNITLRKLWLERSRNHPLSLDLTSCSLLMSTPVLDILFSNMHRWSVINVEIDTYVAHKLTNARPDSMPLLREITVLARTAMREVSEPLIPLLASLDSLSRIHWICFPKNVTTVVWTKLRSIVVSIPVYVEECLELVSNCPKVEEVYIQACFVETLPITNLPVKLVPSIVRLSVWGNEKSTRFFLDHLLIPSLHTLDILDDGRPRPKADREPSHMFLVLEQLCERSLCALTHLGYLKRSRHKNPTAVSQEDYITLLRLACLQNLRSLAIGDGITDAFFHCLTWSSETQLIDQPLPHLRRLDILSSYTSDGILSPMVASRWRSHATRSKDVSSLIFARLRQLTFACRLVDGNCPLDLPYASYSRDRVILSRLAEEGLDLVMDDDNEW